MNYRSMIAAVGASILLSRCGPATGTQVLSPLGSPTRQGVTRNGPTSGLYVANSNPEGQSVTIYDAKQGTLKRTVTKGVNSPSGLLFNASGDMVVINYRGNSVTIYDGKGLKLLQKVKVAKPRRIAQDHEGNLYVLSAASVHVFAPGGSTPYNTAPIRTMSSGISDGEGLAVDSQENVYVANYSKEPNRGNSVAVYADGSNAPTKMITQGVETPFCLAIDASQNLYVGNQGVNGKNSSVTVYASGTLALTATITSGVFIPTALAFDPLGNLYVADGEEVTAYSPGKFNLIRQIGGFGVANALAFSTEGDAYVTDIGRNTVTMYTAKNDSPTLTLRQGIASPSALVLEPR